LGPASSIAIDGGFLRGLFQYRKEIVYEGRKTSPKETGEAERKKVGKGEKNLGNRRRDAAPFGDSPTRLSGTVQKISSLQNRGIRRRIGPCKFLGKIYTSAKSSKGPSIKVLAELLYGTGEEPEPCG